MLGRASGQDLLVKVFGQDYNQDLLGLKVETIQHLNNLTHLKELHGSFVKAHAWSNSKTRSALVPRRQRSCTL